MARLPYVSREDLSAEERVVSMQIRMDGDFTNMPGGFPVSPTI